PSLPGGFPPVVQPKILARVLTNRLFQRGVYRLHHAFGGIRVRRIGFERRPYLQLVRARPGAIAERGNDGTSRSAGEDIRAENRPARFTEERKKRIGGILIGKNADKLIFLQSTQDATCRRTARNHVQPRRLT